MNQPTHDRLLALLAEARPIIEDAASDERGDLCAAWVWADARARAGRVRASSRSRVLTLPGTVCGLEARIRAALGGTRHDPAPYVDAVFYLAYDGSEIDGEQMFRDAVVEHDAHVFKLLVGAGSVPLEVAVFTLKSDGADEAQEAFEEFCRTNDRLDEIGEDGDDPDAEGFGEYECRIEQLR